MGVAMCDEVIFRGRYLHTIEDLQSALGGGEIVLDRQCSYTDDDLLPHCCLCPVDLEQTAAKNGLRLWPSSEGEGVWILSDEDSPPEQGRYVRLEMRGEEWHAVLSAPLPRATIECQCIDGVWYWGMSFSTGMGGEGFAPLPKWQQTAGSEEEAILADDAAESVICTEGHNTEGRQWVLYPEQIAADPYLEDCIAHLEWRGIARRFDAEGGVTVIFEEQRR